MGTEAFILRDVSRETRERLEAYLELLKQWNPKINLVAPGTLAQAWQRHIIDSAQIYRHMPSDANTWTDLGSGGGFPGLVVAILAQEKHPDLVLTLVESDARKSAFLRAVARTTAVKVTVKTERIETIPALSQDVVSARALAPLPLLLGYVHQHLAPGGMALLMKGASWKKELADAEATWRFSCVPHKSETDPNAVILEVGDLEHV